MDGKLLGQGNTAEIYQYAQNKILKLFRSGLAKEIIEREYQNSCAASELLGNMVPKTYEMVDAEGRFGIVYEQIKGRDMMKAMISSLHHVKKMSAQFAEYHFCMQKRTENQFLTVKEKLTDDIRYVKEFDESTKNRILEYLAALPDGNQLCHFDFHPGNIILSNGKPVIIDWMTACSGDPFADAARTCILLQFAELSHVPWGVNLCVICLKKLMYKAYFKEYIRLAGCSREDIESWYLPIAAARLREWISESEKQKLIAFCNSCLKRIEFHDL